MDPRDVRVSVAINLAPWDEKRVETVRLQREMLEGAPGIQSVSVVEAEEGTPIWDSVRECWRKGIGTGSTHHLVLADDVALCRGFPEGLRRALATVPDKPVCPFSVYKAIEEARERGESWVRLKGGMWGQAQILPTEYVGDFLDWERQHVHPDHPHDDTRVNLYATYALEDYVWVTVPSLVEHLGADESLLGNNPPIDRTARWYLSDGDARDIEWERPSDPVTERAKDMWTDYRDILGGYDRSDGL